MIKNLALMLTGKFAPSRFLLSTLILLGLLVGGITITWAAAGSVVVRDRSGRIVETRTTHADGTTEVRDANGRLKETRTRHGNTIYIRDGTGRLLRTESVK